MNERRIETCVPSHHVIDDSDMLLWRALAFVHSRTFRALQEAPSYATSAVRRTPSAFTKRMIVS